MVLAVQGDVELLRASVTGQQDKLCCALVVKRCIDDELSLGIGVYGLGGIAASVLNPEGTQVVALAGVHYLAADVCHGGQGDIYGLRGSNAQFLYVHLHLGAVIAVVARAHGNIEFGVDGHEEFCHAVHVGRIEPLSVHVNHQVGYGIACLILYVDYQCGARLRVVEVHP